MKRRVAVIAFAVAAALAGCQQKAFQPYKSPDGKFEAIFPGDPKVEAKAAAGVSVKMYSVEAWNKAFMVGWADMPIPTWETEARTNSRLFDARDGALAAVNAKSSGTTKVIKLQDRFPGIEFGGSSDDKHVRAQIYLVGHRMYQVIIVGASEEILKSTEAEEFLTAFKVFDVEGLLPKGSSYALPPPPPTFPIESTGGRFIANYPVKPKKFTRKIGENEFTGYDCEAKDGTCAVGSMRPAPPRWRISRRRRAKKRT
jgi:hypothetical protein